MDTARKATPEEKALNEVALAKLLKAYPNLTEDVVGNFLVEATAFPFNSVPAAVEQALTYAEASGGDYEKAINLSNEEFDKAWEAGREEREAHEKLEEERRESEMSEYIKKVKKHHDTL
jgi:hypothetical protein